MRMKDIEKLNMVEQFIKTYAADNNGAAPSLAEIMDATGLAKATAYRQMVELDRRGAIEYSGKGTLRVAGAKYGSSGFKRTPIVGQVVCGIPNEQEEHIEGYVAIPEEWIEGECFLLRAYGDSMIDIGISEGDLVLVKKTESAPDEKVVVALTEEGNTLKRLRYEDGKPILFAENHTYSEQRKRIEPKELSIQGIALKVIKDIR